MPRWPWQRRGRLQGAARSAAESAGSLQRVRTLRRAARRCDCCTGAAEVLLRLPALLLGVAGPAAPLLGRDTAAATRARTARAARTATDRSGQHHPRSPHLALSSCPPWRWARSCASGRSGSPCSPGPGTGASQVRLGRRRAARKHVKAMRSVGRSLPDTQPASPRSGPTHPGNTITPPCKCSPDGALWRQVGDRERADAGAQAPAQHARGEGGCCQERLSCCTCCLHRCACFVTATSPVSQAKQAHAANITRPTQMVEFIREQHRQQQQHKAQQ